jgi:hypothetical protein
MAKAAKVNTRGVKYKQASGNKGKLNRINP